MILGFAVYTTQMNTEGLHLSFTHSAIIINIHFSSRGSTLKIDIEHRIGKHKLINIKQQRQYVIISMCQVYSHG